MSYKRFLLGSVAVCGALASTVPAHAQSAAISSQIQALQDQVRALTQQLQTLQGQVNQTQQTETQTQRAVDQIKTQPQASSGGIVASMPNNRPTLSTADGQNSISLTGRLHFDAGDYLNVSPSSAKGSVANNLNSGVNLRRGRIGVVGKIMGDWNYGLIYDFGGSNDSGPATGTTGGITTGGIETAELTYNGFRPFAIEGGYEDVPYTLEEATSSNDIMFVERSSAQVIAVNLAAGDFRSNFGGHWNNDRAWVGLYGTGPTSGSSHAGLGSQFGAVGRATYQVLQSDNYSFHIGADAEGLVKPPTSGAGGFRQVTTFSDRPELRIDTTQILNTGTLGSAANPVTGASVMGLETAGGFGPLFAQAEYFHYDVSRQSLSDAKFDGGYIEGSYTITGEHRKYIPGTGAYSGITPDHPFSLSSGDWGAFELAARYSVIDLNDHYTTGAATSGSTNAVAGGEQQVIALGLNWYVNSNIRFMFDYLHGIVDRPNGGTVSTALVPLGAGVGAKFDAVALRTQVAW
jgi:phosphate-selective porin OprO/OprP